MNTYLSLKQNKHIFSATVRDKFTFTLSAVSRIKDKHSFCWSISERQISTFSHLLSYQSYTNKQTKVMKSWDVLVRSCGHIGYYIPEDVSRITWLALLRSLFFTTASWFYCLKIFAAVSLLDINRALAIEIASLFLYAIACSLFMTVVNLNYKALWKLIKKLSSLSSGSSLTDVQKVGVGRLCWASYGSAAIMCVIGICYFITGYTNKFIEGSYLDIQMLPFNNKEISPVLQGIVYMVNFILSILSTVQLFAIAQITIWATAIIYCMFSNLNEAIKVEVKQRNASRIDTTTEDNDSKVDAVNGNVVKIDIIKGDIQEEGTREDIESMDSESIHAEKYDVENPRDNTRDTPKEEEDNSKYSFKSLSYYAEWCDELNNVVELLNDAISGTVGIFLLTTTVNICLTLYVAANIQEKGDYFYVVFVLSFGLFILAGLLVCGIIINTKVCSVAIDTTIM